MPSPRAPILAMARRSVTGGADEKLAIAVAAGNGGGRDAGNLPAERLHEISDLHADCAVNAGLAHDPFLQRAAPSLELRLDQRYQARRKSRERERARERQLERNEANIDADEIRRLGQIAQLIVADIGALERCNLGLRSHARMQLAASDID